jgi:putative transposase
VSLLHAYLVFVTKYRRAVFTDAMLTYCETTMRGVCDDLGAELVEFNGETDHVHHRSIIKQYIDGQARPL